MVDPEESIFLVFLQNQLCPNPWCETEYSYIYILYPAKYKQSLQTLKEKVESLKGLDNNIIELHASLEAEDVEVRIEKEIEDSDGVRDEIIRIVLRLEELLFQPAQRARSR